MKFLLSIFILIPFALNAQLPSTIYEPTNIDIYGDAIIPGYDNSFIILGHKDNSTRSFFIQKLDLDGNILTENQIETTTFNPDKRSDLIPSLDSNYISVSNYYVSSSGNDQSTIVVKWDQDLDTLWTTHLDYGTANVWSESITEYHDSTIFIASYGPVKSFISKLDYNGNLLWSKEITLSSGNVNYSSVKEVSDSTLILLNTIGQNETALTKFDSDGNVLWNRSVAIKSKAFYEDKNGNLYLGGTDNSSGNYPHILKLASNGDFIDGDKYLNIGYFPDFVSFSELSDTSFALGAGNNQDGWDAHVFTLDTNLNMISSKNLTGFFKDLCVINNEPYVMMEGPIFGIKTNLLPGHHYCIDDFSNPSCMNTISITPTDVTFQIDTLSITENSLSATILNIQLALSDPSLLQQNSCISVFGSVSENENSSLTIYPNPSNGQFQIESDQGQIIEKIQIHSTDGRLVYTSKKVNASKTTLNIPNLPRGIYYLKANFGSSSIFEKIVIE